MNKKKFRIYESIKESGETNMFNIRNVIELSFGELDKEDIKDIMKNYAKYKKQLLR